jgi:hypothetical protein
MIDSFRMSNDARSSAFTAASASSWVLYTARIVWMVDAGGCSTTGVLLVM